MRLTVGTVLCALLVVGCSSTAPAAVNTTTAQVAVTTTAAPTTSEAATTTADPTTTQPQYEGERVSVARVIDGDTVELATGETVRLLGYDTPERGECGYKDATNALQTLLSAGVVTMTTDDGDNTDKYDRILSHLLVEGVPVGLTIITNGAANARYDSLDGYSRHRYQDKYRATDGPNSFACAASVTAPPTTAAATPPPVNVVYANCATVRAAGAAPIRVGDPGFQSKFDRNGDGVGCE